MVSRAERSKINEWWWTIDRVLLGSLIGLLLTGLVLCLAASPAVAERIGIDNMFHFVNRQAFFIVPAIFIMVGLSCLSPRWVRRVALVLFLVTLTLVVLTLVAGVEVKGSRRWILGIQPSEFLKPAFVVVVAWFFSESAKRNDIPGRMIAIGLLGLVVTLLVLQPDIGQTMLITIVWASLFFVAGMHWMMILGVGGLGVVGLGAAYLFVPHVTSRIDRFLHPEGGGDTFQMDRAIDAFVAGGWFGRGPGEGTVKRILPDSHTDFIAAVTAEEFGILFVMALVGLFAFIVFRALWRASELDDPFCKFGTVGLAVLFGLQSSINIMVNLHMIPAKGMTLPFVSYGGSSMTSVAIGMGFILALTRRRPRTDVLAGTNAWRERTDGNLAANPA